MKKSFISNAFSFNMLAESAVNQPFDMLCTPMTPAEFFSEHPNPFISMSNKATCDLFNLNSDRKIAPDRNNVSMNFGDVILVMQYNGPRLEEGLQDLPSGGTLNFYMVELVQPNFGE